MKSQIKIEFLVSITSLSDPNIPQIMPGWGLIGRSNVGKSTLLNALANKKIARVSSTPGKTITINYYIVEDRWYFVDLPGYGYAKRSKSTIKDWGIVLEKFWKKHSNFISGMLLIDARHVPHKYDLQMVEWLNFYRVPFVTVANKVDKLKLKERQSLKRRIIQAYNIDAESIFLVSAFKKRGLEELLRTLQSFIG